MNPVYSISISGTVIAAILAILLLVAVFSSKRAMMGIVVLAALGMFCFVAAGLVISFVGLRHGRLEHPSIVHQWHNETKSADAHIRFETAADEHASEFTVQVVSTDADKVVMDCPDDDQDGQCDLQDQDDCASCDDEDPWSEDPTLLDGYVGENSHQQLASSPSADAGDAGDAEDAEDDGDGDGDGDEVEVDEDQVVGAAADERPSWAFEVLQVDSNPHRITVTVGPFGTWKEVERKTAAALQDGLRTYADWYLRATDSDLPTGLRSSDLQVNPRRLRECIVDSFDHVHESSSPTVDDMAMRYVLLEFDRDFRDRILEPSILRSQSIARSKNAGILSGFVLAIVASLLGVLKVSATTGKKRPRLISLVLGFSALCLGGFIISIIKR